MQAIPAIIALVGTAVSVSAEQRAARERRGILNAEMERTEKATDKSTSLVNQEGQNYSQAAREQQMKDAEAKNYEQTQADLQGAGGAGIEGAGSAGNVSNDFLRTKAAKAIEEGSRLTAIAREAAKARAPGQMHMNDSLRMASMAGDLGSLWGSTKNVNGAAGLDAQSVTPGALGALGKVATAVGGAMSAGGYGQTTGMEGGIPPNPYATGPYMKAGPYSAGINFGAR